MDERARRPLDVHRLRRQDARPGVAVGAVGAIVAGVAGLRLVPRDAPVPALEPDTVRHEADLLHRVLRQGLVAAIALHLREVLLMAAVRARLHRREPARFRGLRRRDVGVALHAVPLRRRHVDLVVVDDPVGARRGSDRAVRIRCGSTRRSPFSRRGSLRSCRGRAGTSCRSSGPRRCPCGSPGSRSPSRGGARASRSRDRRSRGGSSRTPSR